MKRDLLKMENYDMDPGDINKTIPVMHCFDNNYVIPAAVAFYSLLENSDPNYNYKLYVLHSDITENNQKKLEDTTSCFYNSEIVFINMDNKFNDFFSKLSAKNGFTKEMLYKLIAPSMFPQHKKLIISDVDVVYLGDISKNYINFESDKDNYLITWRPSLKKESWIERFYNSYRNDFSDKETEILKNGASGYLIFNLEMMRKDNIEEKFIYCLNNNIKRLKQPEQDVINLTCYPKIGYLPSNALVCSYLYDLYKSDEDFSQDTVYSAKDIHFLLENPIQLHYATGIKPWKNPGCTKSNFWYEYLLKTPFFSEQMKNIEKLVLSNFELISLKKKFFITGKHFIRKIFH
jgi:lipopolysaccharide biosynthesis glycosyltransferase